MKSDYSYFSIGNAEPYARQKWLNVGGGEGDDPCDHGTSKKIAADKTSYQYVHEWTGSKSPDEQKKTKKTTDASSVYRKGCYFFRDGNQGTSRT